MTEIIDNVWIIADRDQHELGDPWAGEPLALLPVAGRTLLEYTMDDLFEAGVRQANLALSAGVEEIRHVLAGGDRWGIRLKEILTRGNCDPARLNAALGNTAAPALIVHADRLRSPAVDQVLREAQRLFSPADGSTEHRPGFEPGSLVAYGGDGRPLGVEVVTGSDGPSRILVLPTCSSVAIDAPDSLHDANLAVITGQIGVAPHAREIAEGVWAGRQVKIGPGVELSAPSFIGSGCEIGAGAILGAETILGAGCTVDTNARLSRVVVLDNTYIGSESRVEDVLVRGRSIYPMVGDDDTGGGQEIPVAPLSATGARQWLVRRVFRVCFALLTFLLLPLLPLWALASVLANPSRPFVRRRWSSNRRANRTFEVLESTTAIPFLDTLPWLFPVLLGDLDLLGVRPRPAGYVPRGDTPWQREILRTARAGLVGPAQLLSSPSQLEAELAEADWLETRTWKSDLGLILRCVVSGRGPRHLTSGSTLVEQS
ncbi:MAG: NDP-sugar synthase [Holophagales bacterium]|nr:NDP-sugar synthase [Holophagales bacterium]